MPNENLENLVKIGKLKVDLSTGDEIMGLIQRGLLKIEDYKHPNLSIETRFDIVYGAAHAFCLAALKNAGYRSESRYISMTIPIYQVDAFTLGPFSGNPAAVCPLDTWLDDETMQSIAAENNLSETAFIVAHEDGYDLRWFTPAVEVDLCGHATLAAGYVVLNHLQPNLESVAFETMSGRLIVTRAGERLSMDFPARAPTPAPISEALSDALGRVPSEVHISRDILAVYDDETTVRRLAPDQAKLAVLEEGFGVIVTAKGDTVDFVSRFFVPKGGIAEDPVTGSAHCTLVPFWAERLGRTQLVAHQASARGGELHCELRGDRVIMSGQCVLFLTGSINLYSPGS